MSAYTDSRRPGDRAGLRAVRLRQPGPALPRRPVRAVRQPGRARPHGDRRGRRGGRRRELAYFPLWSYAHPQAIELAERLAELAPGDLNRVFFTTSGSEAVESAWKLAKQYFKLTGQPERYKVLSRDIAYHGTSMGALAITGLADIKYPFEPLPPGGVRVPNTNFYRAPDFVADDIDRLRPVGRRRDRARDPAGGPGIGRGRVPGAGAELRRLLPAAARVLRAGARDL